MKKIMFVVAFISATFISQAQVKFGVKAGANFYKFTGDDADFEGASPKFRVGLGAGATVNIPVNSQFSVQPEVLYSMEGSKYKFDEVTLNFETNFINIPVMFQYNNPSGFYAETGPQIGFLMSAKLKAEGESEDAKDSFKSTAFSWGLGLGYRLTNGFGFGARYNLGLNNIVDSDDADLKTSGFHIGVSYQFAGKK